jgi:enamine deaminase RidA (YjgF/YER057c/UK114 family)
MSASTVASVDPWVWQRPYGYVQGIRLERPDALVLVSGQGPVDDQGRLVGQGDIAAQARQTFANLAAVLEAAGSSLERVVQLRVFLLDMAHLRAYGAVRDDAMGGRAVAGTAVGVSALAVPGMLLEVEALAR